MAEQTKIQWCDHTFNPWRGCQKITEGCRNCYAETLSKRNPGTLGIWGSEATGASRVVAAESYWRQPVKWDTFARMSPELGRPRVFCASLADVFEDWQGPMVNSQNDIVMRYPRDSNVEWNAEPVEAFDVKGPLWRHPDPQGYELVRMNDARARLFRLIDATAQLDWLLLTKRPENVGRLWMEHEQYFSMSRDNVWLGVSCATQDDCDRLIPELLKCRDLAAKLFVSLEPLIEPVDLVIGQADWTSELDWVIVGGESGPGSRPCNVEWIRDVVRQCRATGVPCFVKQLGAKCQITGERYQKWPGGEDWGRWDEATDEWWATFRDPKGGDPSEWPEDLRVREVPE